MQLANYRTVCSRSFRYEVGNDVGYVDELGYLHEGKP